MSKNHSTLKKMNMILGESAIYKVVAFLIMIALLLGIYNLNHSYAWFTDSHEENYSLISGKVHFKVNFVKYEGMMIPGKNLLDDITVTNLSTIDTHFRFRVSYNYYDAESIAAGVSKSAIYARNAADTAQYDIIDGKLTGFTEFTQYLNITMDRSLFKEDIHPEGWFEGKATLPAITGSALDLDPQGEVKGEPLPIFPTDGSLIFCYDGPKSGPIFQNQDIVLVIEIQAKQADHITWEDLTIVMAYDAAGG